MRYQNLVISDIAYKPMSKTMAIRTNTTKCCERKKYKRKA